MLSASLETKLIDLARLLVDQRRAKVLIPPMESEGGFWFGGGNLTVGTDGFLYLIGRYRNHGDSRTGLAAGNRGLELAIFRVPRIKTEEAPSSFEKILSFGKQDLSLPSAPVLSIEGSAIRFDQDSVEIYVSTEKDGLGYPAEVDAYLKPGTGVWTIDRLRSPSIETLKGATIETVLRGSDPAFVHVKDPFIYEAESDPTLFFCSHPFNWSCSGTGYVAQDGKLTYDFFPRGNVWDVAMSRGTCIIDVPAAGAFTGNNIQLMFYDGGECVRDHDQHEQSVRRPRGYSCEEIGGAAYFMNGNWLRAQRLSKYEPLFISPFGTGCSRYVDVCSAEEGMYVTWQQSQCDGSQPLVMNFVPQSEVLKVLA